MKKSFIIIGMMLTAALSLTNCTVEIESPVIEAIPSVNEGIPFELFANPAETKTAITGFATRWTASDEVCVFHAITGESTYYKEGAFSIAEEDLATGRFSGTLNAENTPTEGNNYDWYIVYPYNSYLTSPSAGDGRYYIGKRSDQAQIQTGNSTTNHLSGSNFPLYGKATSVAYNESPSISLNPVASIIEVKVTNKNNDPLTVTSVSVTAPSGTSIVGQYTIDFTTNPMTFTNYSTYTSETANLTVNEGAEIAKNEYATFYIGIKPFDVVADAEHPKDLKVSVNGYEKTLSLTRNVSFAPGKIKTISFDFDQVAMVSSWVKTAVGSLSANDIVVIVDEASSRAMTNDNGTSNPPAASSVTIADNKITSTVAANMQWVFETPSEGYSFKVPNSSNYLYCTNTNNGVRIGSNSNKVFTLVYNATESADFLKNNATERYVGVYTTNYDWRCYTSVNDNIKDTRLAFYKKSSTPATAYSIGITPPSNGSVTTSPASTAYESSTVTIVATPSDGYTVSSVSVTQGGTPVATTPVDATHYSFTMPSGDVTVAVSFARGYTITTSATNGTIEVSPATTAMAGETITITANPSVGYAFSSWSVTGASPASTTTSPTTFTMPANDVSVTATFVSAGATYSLYSGTITEGDYVIVYSTNALSNTISSNRLTNGTPTITDEKITNPSSDIIWHIAASGDYWTLYNAAVEKYAGSTGSKNQGALLDSVTDNAKWTVTGTSTYDFANKARAEGANSDNKWLRNNASYGWACYASSTGGALSLYKRD